MGLRVSKFKTVSPNEDIRFTADYIINSSPVKCKLVFAEKKPNDIFITENYSLQVPRQLPIPNSQSHLKITVLNLQNYFLRTSLAVQQEINQYLSSPTDQELSEYQSWKLKHGDITLSQISNYDFDPHKHMFHENELVLIFTKIMSAYTSFNFTKLALTIRKSYRGVTYHNFAHAISVFRGVFLLLQFKSLKGIVCDDERFGMMLGALCHDLDHRGLNNQFQREASTKIGQLYQCSTLEHHHYTQARLIIEPHVESFDFIEDESVFWRSFRESIIATDLAVHVRRRKELESLFEDKAFDIETHKNLVLSMVMTCSDLITFTSKDFRIQKHTGLCVYEEFFKQGDEERRRGLKVGEWNQRCGLEGLKKIQKDFSQKIIKPAFKMLTKCTSSETGILEELVLENCRKWQEIESLE